ncbi:efflux RND transporter periplasmic adaptor subunit [Desulfopila sp. IMCC35006]|uniref:efflux RND transporter periplasmic adaptor subunit n=1 Tax=Desulfopila sp. IMCC35006 TaxID=2569542 RepID=UPI0010AB503C|nr:efflux RND transporter periplasmic adaptor subunit [Desulfopila sp. IMCC35006]TKB26892.1 efflux RND transporter periplasmic adaptor subunit [Desulfopila sp. IMCC35006]
MNHLIRSFLARSGTAGGRCIPLALIVVCLLFLLAGCLEHKGKHREKADRPKKAMPVTIGLSAVKNVPVALSAIGTVEPFATVAIKSQITGILKKVHFQEGDDVKKGDLLFTLDERPFIAQLNQARGTLARDRAELENARKEQKRYSLAAGKGYVSSEQEDTAATRVATLGATVQADEAAVENSRLQLEFCSIVAPIDGRTGELLVTAGNLIKANGDTAMVTLNQITPIKVSFTVPAKNLPEIKKYQAAESLQVQLPGVKGDPLTGAFSFFDNRIDSSTGTVLLKATFANIGQDLWPGQFVDVQLVLTTRPGAVVVPSQAIQVRQDGAHIYVVHDDMTVEDRPVTTAMIVDKETVVEKGLVGGEKVVTEGQLQLTDGTKVQDRKRQVSENSKEHTSGKREGQGKS